MNFVWLPFNPGKMRKYTKRKKKYYTECNFNIFMFLTGIHYFQLYAS